MFQTTSKFALLGLALLAVCALAACSDSKPGGTAAAKPAAGAVSKDATTEPTVVINGKEWMRCALGQTWEGNTCAGEAKGFTFDEAQTAAKELNAQGGAHGKTDWRVPTVRELASLRVCSTGFDEVKRDVGDSGPEIPSSCKDGSAKPTLDAKQFPNMPNSFYSSFWSSSPYVWMGVPDSSSAWGVVFNHGGVDGGVRSGILHVRLVRASQ